MKFLNPLLLAGLAAVLLPIIIHLINRKRAQRVQFPAMNFLLRSQQEMARKLKVKQWLLLLARISVFLLLPLAMAQPYSLCGASATSAGGRLPASVVFIIDDSASMSYSDGRATYWDAAVGIVEDELRAMRSWDRAAILVAGTEPAAIVGDFSDDRSALRRELERWNPREGASNIPAAVDLARQLQLESDQPSKRTVIITDSARNAWEVVGATPEDAQGVGEVVIRTVRDDEHLPNFAISSVSVDEATDGTVDTYDVTVNLSRTASAEPETEVTLFVDQSPVGTAIVEFGDRLEDSVTFQHRFEAGQGLRTLRAEVSEQRGLRADNVVEVPLLLERNIRTLIVNGDPRSVQYNDELFYLGRALRATLSDQRGIETTVTNGDGFAGQELDQYDVIVLANVSRLPAAQVQRIYRFVNSGGGVFMTAGSQVEPERWNSFFGDLLPRPVRSITKLTEPRDPNANIKATRLSDLESSSPIFRVFSMPGGESLQSARIFQFVLLEPGTPDDVRVFASYEEGGPALLEKRIGKGSVMLWTSSIDFDWTDLPIRTAFLPFVQRTMEYLARRTGSESSVAEVGRRRRIEVPDESVSRALITGPSDERFVLEVRDGEASFVPQSAGLYRVSLEVEGAADDMPSMAFSARSPLSETDLAAVSPSVLDAWRDASRGVGVNAEDRMDIPENRRSAWPILLFVLVVILYAESLLSFRRRFWARMFGSDKTENDPLNAG